MLETLRIENYALIDALEIDFCRGFNVLSGETGAGKSIIVGALSLVLGGRASAEVLRDPAGKTKVDAVFRIEKPSRRILSLLRAHDIEMENGELLLSRVVMSEGRSRAYVCGNIAPISVLAAIGDELVDLHGQHEHQSLLKPERQLDLLDAFAGTDDDVSRIADAVTRLRQVEKEIGEAESDDRERTRRVEFLRFELSEIDAANLVSGEEERAKARRNLIANAEKVYALAEQARTMLYEGEQNSAIDAVDGAHKNIEELARIDERFRALADRLFGVRSEIEAVAAELRELSGNLEFDPEELESLNQRIALIGNLKRKYGASVDAILEYRNRAADEIGAYDSRDKRLAEMRAQQTELCARAEQAASELSRKRAAAARKLDRKVAAALQELAMKGGTFVTAFERTGLTLSGVDRIEFLLAANPGEKPKPLRQVASGGEISRIMLALKAVFASADRIPTLIFDEIDAGVGGKTATSVARKLRELAASHQTICITHIAQIAAAAQAHFQVAKTAAKGRTATSIALVDGETRIQEIARLLDGSVSEVSLDHARALLAKK